MRIHVDDYVDRLQTALDDLDRHLLARLRDALIRVYRDDKQVFIIGNGGSSSTASHMAADLAKNTIGPNMKRFKVATLSENAAIVTALANDVGYENVFYEQLVNVIHAGDVLIVVSASGNSPNVLKAIKYAQRQSAEVVGLLGFGGGEAAELADIAIVVKSQSYGIVEDVHLSINHMLVECFREDLAASRPWAV
jgi:D-sedoheptulose 7-phosphate isomerase